LKTSKVPVLVIGAGAAGTMLTLELARRGVRVRTIDGLPKPMDTSRAIIVHARMLEIFERIDKRLIERYLDRGIHNKGYVLHFVDATGARTEARPRIDFTKLDSRYPFLLVSRQSETEQYLREYTGAHYGVAPDWDTTCVDVRQEGGVVVATLEAGGVHEEVRCDYLVACDGSSSRVRQAIGLAEQESDDTGVAMQNLDAYLNDFPDADDWVHYCADVDHSIMIVKLPGGFYRMLRSDRDEAAGPALTPEQAFMPLVNRHFDGVTLGEVVWHSKWRSDVRPAQTYRQGRVFLAGDSAHVHATTGGQGLSCCMQDAYNLGWKLAFVVKGLARPTLLDTYETERKPIAEQVDWAASSLQDIFLGYGKDVAASTRKARDPDLLEVVAGRCSGISYTYREHVPKTDGLAPLEGPAPGDRAPDVDLGGGRALFDLTRHPRCTLLALPATERGGGKLELDLKPLAHRFKAVMDCHTVPPSDALSRRYGDGDHDRLFLLRPDGYVGFRCLATEVPRLEGHLTEWFVL
jgi:2-polyprenyl-6-methoxyphenol hydroxylase-like FAD-dependent oxidoreductase